MKCIVCQNDMDTGTLVEAVDEFDAVDQFHKEMGFVVPCDLSCNVYSIRLCLPQIDLRDVLDDWGENNPEFSPLDIPWSKYIGADDLHKFQTAFDKLIAEHVEPWYASDKMIMRYRNHRSPAEVPE